jgi:hypothetical protein
MNYTTKRIEEIYENDKLVSVSFAVCVTDGERGITKQVSLPDIEAYLLDKEGVIKAFATEVAASITLPDVPVEKEVIILENITLDANEVLEERIKAVDEVINIEELP